MELVNHVANRRRHKRFPLALPVVLEWTSVDQANMIGTGVTRDISTNGVFVVSECAVPLNAWVNIRLSLPSRSGPARRMKMYGQVLRTSEVGFAVSSKKQLVRERPRVPRKSPQRNGSGEK